MKEPIEETPTLSPDWSRNRRDFASYLRLE